MNVEIGIGNRDILLRICVCSDNATLESLSRTVLWDIMREFVSKQYFWYLRTSFLMNASLQLRAEEDWRSAYHTLAAIPDQNEPFTEAVSNSLLCLSILSEVGYLPTSTAMIHSVEANNLEATKFIIQYGLRKNAHRDDYIMMIAADENYVDILSALIEEGKMDPSHNESAVLRAAIESGCIEATKLLLADSRVDPIMALTTARESDRDNAREVLDLLQEDWRVRKFYGVEPQQVLHLELDSTLLLELDMADNKQDLNDVLIRRYKCALWEDESY